MGIRRSEEVMPTLFDLPEKRLMMPPGPIMRSAEIMREANCRFVLKRAWGPGPCILWCGANPSDADDQRDDPTMLREIGFSFRWGFGSLVKINIEPYISSDPAEMQRWTRDHTLSGELRMMNLDHVVNMMSKVEVRVAAWGNLIHSADVDEFVELVTEVGRAHSIDGSRWKCLGTTNSGAPKHTLARGKHRIPDDAVLQDWRHPHSFGPY
ncbi:MAG: DUF1643 domain-containing protein [Proteobacteria bacterium]|nr:DUF1643 domain-containing protein [Pseudomonadota bacterium]